MTDCLILNDASLPFPDKVDPAPALMEFFKILKMANDVQISFNQTDENQNHWSKLNYSSSFNFGIWLNNTLDDDDRRKIKNILTKIACPFKVEAKEIIQEGAFVLKEDDTIETQALGVAGILRLPSISFGSNEKWERDSIEIYGVTNDSCFELQVKNICKTVQAETHFQEVMECRLTSNDHLKSLQTRNNLGFSNLLFNDEVLKTFQKSNVVNQYVLQIIHVLKQLNSSIVQSKSLNDLCEHSGLDISGESSSTMNEEKHARKRRFSHPDHKKDKQSFEIHIKNFPNSRRMHIIPDYHNSTVCVGYFGPHLSTSRNPT